MGQPPGPGDGRIAAFLTDADHPQRQALRRAAGFAKAVAATQLIRHWLQHRALEAAPLLIDAALAFEPLSSQGLLTAPYTGLRGAECVIAALDGTGDNARSNDNQHLQAIRQAYRRHRQEACASERRWPQSPFWARRQGAA